MRPLCSARSLRSARLILIEQKRRFRRGSSAPSSFDRRRDGQRRVVHRQAPVSCAKPCPAIRHLAVSQRIEDFRRSTAASASAETPLPPAVRRPAVVRMRQARSAATSSSGIAASKAVGLTSARLLDFGIPCFHSSSHRVCGTRTRRTGRVRCCPEFRANEQGGEAVKTGIGDAAGFRRCAYAHAFIPSIIQAAKRAVTSVICGHHARPG